ncbi:hypothetical protein [Sulfurirhabdus autotrophica]|uniref:Methyl-accepting chemotaxis protein n=1 Tax=Sulfurirhabdus autotrophica TaxID=1706046 RepID=A0A4R3XVU3_9PROT|nr:hypothetical protein [Sulfurirhabdus autotrophica]TCV83300.1 hypothetical protein EDC63_11650 [Sulfurirhabdus autotrophica]
MVSFQKNKTIITTTLQVLLLITVIAGIKMVSTSNWQFAPEDYILLLFFIAGWMLIIRRALTFKTQNYTDWQKTSAEFEQLTQKTQGLFNDMAREFNAQFNEAKHELTQLRVLLEDAIHKLLTSFTAIENQTRQQHAIYLKLTENISHEKLIETESSANNDALVAQIGTLSEQTGQNVRTTITSLQFQDLAAQIIAHVSNRLDSLESIMKNISNVHMTLNQHDSDNLSNLIQNLNHFKKAINEASELISKAKYNPVSQTHMGAGDIDLF